MNDNINTVKPLKNQKKINISVSRWKRKILSHVKLIRVLILIFSVLTLLFISYWVKSTWVKWNLSTYTKTIHNFITSPIDQLASNDGRTNILVMGKAGGTHDGPDLTDTLMLVSVSLKSHDVKIISIPRDLWIPDIRAKVNSAYYWGNQKNVGGIDFAKAEVSGVVGIPIHYGSVIDFSGFTDLINEIGGIEVNVERSFTDYYYPIKGLENDMCGGRDPEFMCRYETLHFDQGKTLMDGETALKFVRSRHADGIDGTDIAREARQGKVIEAVKNKLSDKNTYTNLNKDIAIVKVVLNSIETDIDYPTAGIIARKIYDLRNSIDSYLIPAELLVNPAISEKYDMQSVFVPKLGNGKWEEINTWVASILK